MKSNSASLKARLRSFRFAGAGIRSFFLQEPNARIHLLATILLIPVFLFMHLTTTEKLLIILVTGGVWITEIINTAIERIMDLISTERDPRIGMIKDLAAAAVLVAAIIALLTALIILLPKFF